VGKPVRWALIRGPLTVGVIAAEMINNYQIIIERNLKALFANDLQERAGAMVADWNGRFLGFSETSMFATYPINAISCVKIGLLFF